jgi:predicted RNA binding protein YcfA (HicA-like mRNA interferase family)
MKLRNVDAKAVIKALEKVGFSKVRQRGSHIIFKNPDGRVTVVPVHSGEKLGPGILSKIIRDASIKKAEFLKILEELMVF